jgi:hypothetical protein
MAQWSYDCSRAGSRWRITMRAIHARRRAQPHSEDIVVAAGRAGGDQGPTNPHSHGTTPMTMRGTTYMTVEATRGCSWSISALLSR